MDPAALGMAQRLACPLDILGAGARQPAHHAVLHPAGNLGHRFKVAVRCDREPGLDHIDAHGLEDLRHLDFFIQVHGGARRLFAVTQCRIENQNAVGAVSCLLAASGSAIGNHVVTSFSDAKACEGVSPTRFEVVFVP